MTGTPDTVTAVARYYLTICSFNGNEFGIMIKCPYSFVLYIRNESRYEYQHFHITTHSTHAVAEYGQVQQQRRWKVIVV